MDNKTDADKIVVIDDFVAPAYQDELERVITSNEFPMYMNMQTCLYNESVPAYQQMVDRHTRESPHLVHVLVREGEVSSDFWPLVAPFLYHAMNTFDKKLTLERIKVNLGLGNLGFLDTEYHPPHKDTDIEGAYVGVYYVNDSDGDTVFFEEPDKNITTGEFKVIKRATPKKGRFVLFPATLLHAGRPPIRFTTRYLINFIFRVDK